LHSQIYVHKGHDGAFYYGVQG